MIINNNPNIKRIFSVPASSTQQKATKDTSVNSFEQLLQDKLRETQDIKFSKHAEQRLKTRNIQLSNEQKKRLSDAVGKADAKGIKESLVLMENMAFIVSVKNKTVVTCAKGDELKDNVFTNIDGAVIS